MAQGKSKGLQKKQESSRHSAKIAANTRKGRRVIPPKKAAAVKTASLHKSLSAKINRSIEHQLASAASPSTLTILRNEVPADTAVRTNQKLEKWIFEEDKKLNDCFMFLDYT